ncbi:MAG: HAD-IIA family hydrolase [Micrococcales bacterium]|nr:HAD-IIA family hydrolase [Micrococcales bacterium]
MISAQLIGSEGPLAEVFDVALCDLDGVTFAGTEPIAHAAQGIAEARDQGMRFNFLTNNASRSPEEVVRHLKSVGIKAKPSEIYTASQAGAAMVADDFPKGTKVLAVGGSSLATALKQVGLVPVSSALDEPAAVLQGFGPNVGWTLLAEATYAINQGAAYYATNLDATLPTERGFAPGNGSLVAAVSRATGVEPRSAGKPEPALFLAVAGRARAKSVIVLGDRLETDIAGALNAGLYAMLVMTGVTTPTLVLQAPPACRPHFIALDLRGLGETHPPPRREGEWWVVGTARARLGPSGPELGAWGTAADRLRAAATLAWTLDDDGSRLSDSDLTKLVALLGESG